MVSREIMPGYTKEVSEEIAFIPYSLNKVMLNSYQSDPRAERKWNRYEYKIRTTSTTFRNLMIALGVLSRKSCWVFTVSVGWLLIC